MSHYKLVSGFKVLEFVAAVGLITILTALSFHEYRTYIKNSFAGNFIYAIYNAKTEHLVDAAFNGIDTNSETDIVHSQKTEDYSVFKHLVVDKMGKITLVTPDKTSDFWYSGEFIDDFSERQMSMYIHQTGSQAYGFWLLTVSYTHLTLPTTPYV